MPQPDHGENLTAGHTITARADWERDDTYGVDERARHGFTEDWGPRLKNFDANDDGSVCLFALAKHFLPVDFLAAMAAKMQQVGLRQARTGRR